MEVIKVENSYKRAEKIFNLIKNVTGLDYKLNIAETSEYVWEVKYAPKTVFISTRAIDEVDDDELAFVFSHEFAHVLKKEIHQQQLNKLREKHVQQYQESIKNLKGGGLSKFFWVILYTAAGFAGGYVKGRSLNRDQERTVDELAIEITQEAGFDPSAGVKFFARDGYQARGFWNSILATHPDSMERAERIRNKLK